MSGFNEESKKGKIRTTIIDVCEKCSGIWLDKGELESIQLDYEMCENNIAGNRSKKTNNSTEPKSFKCPKCNHPQLESSECVKCGVIFAKYVALQQHEQKVQIDQKNLGAKVDDIYSDLKGYEFNQQPCYVEAFVGFETRNEYSLGLIGTNYSWVARETRGLSTAILRNILGGFFPYTLEVYDHNRNLIFNFKEKYRYFFSRTDVYDANGKYLGHVERGIPFIRRKLTIHNLKGVRTHTLASKVNNPFFFIITRNNRKCGEVTKKWNGVVKEYFTDADKFSIRFNQGTDKTSKIMFLASAYLIDKTYFEGGDDQRTLGQILGIPFLDSIFGNLIFAVIFISCVYFFSS
jgi:transcription elongation factor Elf1/uncharacterized protein YxjI